MEPKLLVTSLSVNPRKRDPSPERPAEPRPNLMVFPKAPEAAPVRGFALNQRQLLLLVGVLVAVHCVLAWTTRIPGLAWMEDDAAYALLARELAHGTYRDRWFIEAPVQARFPPVFPALVAVTNAAFGEHLDVQIAFVILCSAASLLLLFDVVRRHLGDFAALFVVSLLAVNPGVINDAGMLMAESPFRLLATLTLWATSIPNPSTRRLLLASGSAALAALTRTAGVAVIVALLVHWLLERRWRAIGILLLSSIPVAAWTLWTLSTPDSSDRALYAESLTNAWSPEFHSRFTDLAARIVGHIFVYGRQAVPTSLSFFALKHNWLDNALWGVLLLLTVPLGLLVVWKRWRLLVLMLIFYAGVLLAWPWSDSRFIGPWNGFLLVILAAGILTLTKRWGPAVQCGSLALIAGLFLVGAIQAGAPVLRDRLACDRSRRALSPSCHRPDERGYLQLAEYVRTNTPPEALFFTPKEITFYYLTQRKSVRDSRITRVPANSLGDYLRAEGVTYATVTPIGIFREKHNSMLAHACRDFELVRAFEGGAILLRVRPAGPIDYDDETCRVLAEWRDGIPPQWREE